VWEAALLVRGAGGGGVGLWRWRRFGRCTRGTRDGIGGVPGVRDLTGGPGGGRIGGLVAWGAARGGRPVHVRESGAGPPVRHRLCGIWRGTAQAGKVEAPGTVALPQRGQAHGLGWTARAMG